MACLKWKPRLWATWKSSQHGPQYWQDLIAGSRLHVSQ